MSNISHTFLTGHSIPPKSPFAAPAPPDPQIQLRGHPQQAHLGIIFHCRNSPTDNRTGSVQTNSKGDNRGTPPEITQRSKGRVLCAPHRIPPHLPSVLSGDCDHPNIQIAVPCCLSLWLLPYMKSKPLYKPPRTLYT